jgi:hypothetical protein
MLSSIIKTAAIIIFAALIAGCNADAPTIVSPATNSSAPGRSGSGQPASSQPAAGQPAASAGSPSDLQFQTPDGWISEQPSSSMRVAQYRLPGDAGDASLVVFFFGPGQGGPVEANLDRWIGQMKQPDGSSSKEKAKTETTTINGMKVTLLDVAGTYSAGDMMGGAGTPQDKPNSRMRAGVFETAKGAYYVKLVGPEKTIERWDQAYMAFIKSAKLK